MTLNFKLKRKFFTRVEVVQGPTGLASFAIEDVFEKLSNCSTNSSQILEIIGFVK